MKFAHIGDCHLGGWRNPEMNALNFMSFQMAINKILKEKVEFVLITGDFFDNPYPPIETLKDAFSELKKLKENGINVFYITGSHDYSASGKTFLEVIERAGFCTNVMKYEEKNGSMILLPTIYKNVAIYGYPGKKSSMEIEEIENIKIQDAPGMFKILMLHTALRDAVGTLPIKAVDHHLLPQVNYLALSHLHINYAKEGRVYSGPIFPNNISELEDLGVGSFYIFDNGKIIREELKPKDIITIKIELTESLTATEKIISILKDKPLKDKVVLLILSGILSKGKTSDIDYPIIEKYIKETGAYAVLRNSSRLLINEPEMKLKSTDNINLEEEIIKDYEEKNPNKFNQFIVPLIKSLQIEKMEDEKMAVFEDRVVSESKKILKL